MVISSTELKTNMNKYFGLLGGEDIIVTKNGRKIAKIIKEDEEESRIKNIYSLYGILGNSKLSDHEIKKIIREERNTRYDSYD